jgi:hypothetical protein
MDTTTQILSGLFGIAIVLLIAPRVLAVNQGNILRNMALWVAIFLGLAIAYKTVGPGANLAATSKTEIARSADQVTGSPQQPANDEEPAPEMQINEENGFSPPQGD